MSKIHESKMSIRVNFAVSMVAISWALSFSLLRGHASGD